MADYATIGFVRALNAHRTYNATSLPTSTQVTSYFIPAVTGEINSRFAAVGIPVPITTSATHSAYKFINQLASKKVACMAENAVFMGGNKDDSPHARVYCEEFEKTMQAIEKNPDIMTAIINGTDGSVMDSYEYSNDDKQRDPDDEPFKRDELNW